MLRLRERIVSHLPSSSSTSPICFLCRRLLSASAPPSISPNPSGFAVEDYLVDTCGLTRPQAFKASKKLPHLNSPANPNAVLAFLRECGLDCRGIAKLCIREPRMLTANPDRVRAMAACAERLGVSRGSGMFREALEAVAFRSEMNVTAKVDYLKRTFGWSDAEVLIALSAAPMLLRRSKDILRRSFEFLVSEAGLRPGYVAHCPVILYYSLEGRIKPRCYVLKFLKENGLVDRRLSFCYVVKMTEKVFVEKLVSPHKEAAPHLAEDYATVCKGEVPASFRFT